jgi:hypothetical protein
LKEEEGGASRAMKLRPFSGSHILQERASALTIFSAWNRTAGVVQEKKKERERNIYRDKDRQRKRENWQVRSRR